MIKFRDAVVIESTELIGSSILKQNIGYYEKEKTRVISFEINPENSEISMLWDSGIDYIEFKRLVQDWKEKKKYISSLEGIFSIESYKQIIKKGDVYLSYIFDEMKTEPDYWFDALSKITKVDPVKHEHWGNLKAMTNDWLDYLYKIK